MVEFGKDEKFLDVLMKHLIAGFYRSSLGWLKFYQTKT
jgi:hypothetical protein